MRRREFEGALARFLNGLAADGHDAASITAGGLHRLVGGYPGPDHTMPVCCSVMREAMHEGDRILNAPPKGDGESLEICYRLPRLELSVGALRAALADYPDDALLFFGAQGSRPLVQIEFNENYRLGDA